MWSVGGAVTQRFAKPSTSVQIWYGPHFLYMPRWWNGIHKRLKTSREKSLASSSLARGTNKYKDLH